MLPKTTQLEMQIWTNLYSRWVDQSRVFPHFQPIKKRGKFFADLTANVTEKY